MTHRVAIGPSSFAEEDPSPLDLLARAGVEVRPNPFGRRLTEDETIAHLDGIDGLIAGLEPLNRKVLEACPSLKAIARVGIGMTNVDLEAARERGIAVSNTPEGPTDAVAEMTVAAMLCLCRRLVPSDAALHAGQWKKLIGSSLAGAVVLLVGYGRIGRRAAALLAPFQPELLVFDPYLDSTADLGAATRVESLADGLRRADIVSLHAAGVDCILDAAAFDAMRDGVILLNSARGELVDEPALVRALESGRVAAAWFDAFAKEPYAGALTRFEQVLLTPHVGTYTRQCRLSMETAAVNHLLRDLGIAPLQA